MRYVIMRLSCKIKNSQRTTEYVYKINWIFVSRRDKGDEEISRHLLLQSCELAHRFRSSVCRVFPLPCFLMLLPHPAVIVPRREKARFTIGEEGTLLGLNTSEPVSHRNREAAPQGTELRFTEDNLQRQRPRWESGCKMEVGDISSRKLSSKRERTRQRRKRALRIFICRSTCEGSNCSVRIIVE